MVINMATKESYLDFKLEKAIAKISISRSYNDSPVFLEVCNCTTKGGCLIYDTRKQSYHAKGSCNRGLLCAMLQEDKHHINIKRTNLLKLQTFENLNNLTNNDIHEDDSYSTIKIGA